MLTSSRTHHAQAGIRGLRGVCGAPGPFVGFCAGGGGTVGILMLVPPGEDMLGASQSTLCEWAACYQPLHAIGGWLRPNEVSAMMNHHSQWKAQWTGS